MPRSRHHDKENESQRPMSSYRGNTPHTYTAMSHEDMLRSYLQLDAQRSAQLPKLEAENKRLAQELKRAQEEIINKENKINALMDQLRDRQKNILDSHSYQPHSSQLIEVDGQRITIEELIHHYNVVIQKHHDLLNQRNKQIHQLQIDLNNQNAITNKNDMQTQSSCHNIAEMQEKLIKEFSNEMALIRKEYENVIHILMGRKDHLESLIINLQKKLDENASEITGLKNELLAKEKFKESNEKTIEILREKETENEFLKATIMKLNDQIKIIQKKQMSGKIDLEHTIKKVIEDKNIEINTLYRMFNNITKSSLESQPNKNFIEVENECKILLSNLNDMTEKLNSFLFKMKENKHPDEQEYHISKNLILDLEQLKKQCKDQINTLNNAIAESSSPFTASVILKDNAFGKIDDHFVREQIEKGEEGPEDPVKTKSNIKFMIYPESICPQETRPRKQGLESVGLSPDEYFNFKPQSPVSSLSTIQGQEFKTTPKTYNFLQIDQFPCEACRGNWPVKSTSNLPQVMDILPVTQFPLETQQKNEKKGKHKGGCCSKKESETSVPYYKEEKVTQIHDPIHSEVLSSRPKIFPIARNRIYTKR